MYDITTDWTGVIMDGYKIETDKHVYLVLINIDKNYGGVGGYLTSEDNVEYFIGANLREVKLTNTALNQAVVDENIPYGTFAGGIQFVDFSTDKGVFQLAVYNEHNGYYGRTILVAKDNELLLKEYM